MKKEKQPSTGVRKILKTCVIVISPVFAILKVSCSEENKKEYFI
jgi:hypothetical protein